MQLVAMKYLSKLVIKSKYLIAFPMVLMMDGGKVWSNPLARSVCFQVSFANLWRKVIVMKKLKIHWNLL